MFQVLNGSRRLERISQTGTPRTVSERAAASEPRERPAFAPKALRRGLAVALRAKADVGEFEGRSPRIRLVLIRAEGEEAAITVLHDKFPRVPGRVAEGSRELDSARDILGV